MEITDRSILLALGVVWAGGRSVSGCSSSLADWSGRGVPRRRCWRVAGGGTAFQPGSAAVGSATVMSGLVFQLTGSPVAVGAVSTNLRLGWLLLQLL